MLRPSAAWWLFPFIALLVACAPGPTRAQTSVDLALVLAMDASSMDPDEQQIQRQGYVDAFRSPTLHDGVLGKINASPAIPHSASAPTNGGCP